MQFPGSYQFNKLRVYRAQHKSVAVGNKIYHIGGRNETSTVMKIERNLTQLTLSPNDVALKRFTVRPVIRPFSY